MRRRLILLVVLILFIAIGLVVTRLLAPNSKSVSNKFVQYTLAGKVDESYALFSTSAKKNTSKADWSSSVSQLKSFFSGQAPTYKDKSTVSGRDEYHYTLKSSNNDYTFTVIIEKESGDFKVWSFTSDAS